MPEESSERDTVLSDEEGTSDLDLTRAALIGVYNMVELAGGTDVDFYEAARRMLGDTLSPRRVEEEVLDDNDDGQR